MYGSGSKFYVPHNSFFLMKWDRLITVGARCWPSKQLNPVYGKVSMFHYKGYFLACNLNQQMHFRAQYLLYQPLDSWWHYVPIVLICKHAANSKRNITWMPWIVKSSSPDLPKLIELAHIPVFALMCAYCSSKWRSFKQRCFLAAQWKLYMVQYNDNYGTISPNLRIEFLIRAATI